jgi:hypothetical protein
LNYYTKEFILVEFLISVKAILAINEATPEQKLAMIEHNHKEITEELAGLKK